MYVLIRTIKIVLDGEATAESMALDTGIRTLFPVHLPKDTRSLLRTRSQEQRRGHCRLANKGLGNMSEGPGNERE